MTERITPEIRDVALFNIVLEAKVRALVPMIRKYHPDWDDEYIKTVVMSMLEKELKKGE